ncbi:hypothetical protein AQJ11_24775 [Streptomyces corchorusii]|uniref:Uncharacterized protein n=2 Tax=Streptomyces TaxID=1883 RepID=A0A101Q3P0_STRCK|nr:hypothetical protein [Streptomyces corchorusii]KUN22740.1 hypothetical protein AQJ11_24775 [Streptomyces corchorusii]
MSNFLLWLDRFERGDGVAVVEVMRTNIGRVVDGDPEFTQGIADALRLPLSVREWSIEVFRSSYYSEYPESDDWRDRYPEVSRITLSGDVTGDGEVEPALEPAEFDGYDSTWSPNRRKRADPNGRYAAIGVRVGEQVDDALAERIGRIRPGAMVDTVVARSNRLRGTRVTLDLGTVDLESDAEAVDEVAGRLWELGLIINRRDVELRLAELGN